MKAERRLSGVLSMLKRMVVLRLLFAGILFAGFVTVSFASDENQNVCNGDPNQWRQLFNGKDLTGWKHVGPGGDTVEEGLIKSPGGEGAVLRNWRQDYRFVGPWGLTNPG